MKKILYIFMILPLICFEIVIRKLDLNKIKFYEATYTMNSKSTKKITDYSSFLNINIFLNIDINLINDNYYNANLDVVEKIGLLDRFDNVYISSYSPIVTITIDGYDKVIDSLSSSIYINKIDVVQNNVDSTYNFSPNNYNNMSSNVNSDHRNENINKNNIRNSNEEKVKVAILEFYNIQQNNYINCEVITLPQNPVYDPTNDMHKLNVGVTLYNTFSNIIIYDVASSHYNYNYITILDLLVSNNIHLATMSYGGNVCQTYVEEEQIFDYYISNYNISITKSASNDSEETTPGGAYNIFSVGSAYSNNDISFCQSEDTYECPYNDKPNILAIGNSPLNPYQYVTSYATPRFAGNIANLIYLHNNLLENPELIMAVFSATADIEEFKLNGYNTFSSNGMEDKCGAGLSNITSALSVVNNNYYGYGSIYSPRETSLINRNISLASGQEITICLVTPKKNFISSTTGNININVNIPNFSIKLTKNNILINEVKSSSPVKILRYTATSTENITLSIIYPGYQTYSNTADYAYAFIIR